MKQFTTVSTRLLFAVVVLLVMTAMATTAWGQVKFEENFSYIAGTNLTANGWSAHSGAGTNPHKVATVGLSYTGYASSGIALADTFTTNGEDVNKTYASAPSGSASGNLYYGV